MKKAFLMSFILHAIVVLAFLGITSLSFKEIKKNSPMQLSMEIFGDSNLGKGNIVKGVEDSKSNTNVNQHANSSKNLKKAEQKEKKEVVSKKHISEKKDNLNNKNNIVKNEKKKVQKIKEKDNTTENKENDSVTAIIAAKGKSQGGSIGDTQNDGGGKSVGGLEGVYTLKEVDDKPKLMQHTKPEYPKEAYSMRIEGSVRVMFAINDKGEVINPIIVKSNPPDVFEKAALNAVKQWKFKPAKKNGEVVNVKMVVPINFSIDRN